MDALIILDTEVTPHKILAVQERPNLIKVLERPSNCVLVVNKVEGAPDTVESVDPPTEEGTVIATNNTLKGYFHYDVNTLKTIWESQGSDVSLLDTFISENDLAPFDNPRRGYLVYDTELLKPFLIAEGVDVSMVEEFEKRQKGEV